MTFFDPILVILLTPIAKVFLALYISEPYKLTLQAPIFTLSATNFHLVCDIFTLSANRQDLRKKNHGFGVIIIDINSSYHDCQQDPTQ